MKKLLFAAISVVLISSVAVAQDFPKVEIFGGYSWMQLGGDAINDSFDYWNEGNSEPGTTVSTSEYLKSGFTASAAFNLNEYFGIAGDFQYNSGDIVEFRVDSDIKGDPLLIDGRANVSNFTFMAGPRFTLRKQETIQPFGHFLLGVSRIKMTPSMDCTIDGSSCPDDFIDEMLFEARIADFSNSAFAFAFGGGVDISISRTVAVRVIQFDYIKAYHTVNTDRIDPEDANLDMSNKRYSVGIVFKLGQE